METLWSSNTETAYGLYLDKGGSILFSSGDKGKIYSLSPKRELTLLIETTEEQTTRLIPAGDGLVACTSNLARVYRLRKRLNPRGSFESKVQDSTVVSRWGSVSWQAKVPKGAKLKLYTRSGNTRRPDGTWSDWSKAYTRAEGRRSRVPRPATFSTRRCWRPTPQASPELSRVVIPYLQQNLAPEVKSIRILPQGVAFLKSQAFSSNPRPVSPADREAADISGAAKAIPEPPTTSSRPRRAFQRGSRSFTWKASDPNGDKLAFTIHYRGEGESNWKLLVRDHPRRNYTLQSGALPDGSYLLKIVASDAPSNPSSSARSGELVSAPFIIDNMPPAVEVLSRRVREGVAVVRFRVADRVSVFAGPMFQPMAGNGRPSTRPMASSIPGRRSSGSPPRPRYRRARGGSADLRCRGKPGPGKGPDPGSIGAVPPAWLADLADACSPGGAGDSSEHGKHRSALRPHPMSAPSGGPLGFSISDSRLRRAGLDYWPSLKVTRHASLEELQEAAPDARFYYVSTKATRLYTEVSYRWGDYLVFGSETRDCRGS